MYITAAQDGHCDSGAVAWALPCLYDTDTNRPLLVRGDARARCFVAQQPRAVAYIAPCERGARAGAAPRRAAQRAHNRPPTHAQGSANICPANLAAADPDAAASVLVHELMHALGFTDDSFDKFVDAEGAPIPKEAVVREVTDPYGRCATGGAFKNTARFPCVLACPARGCV